MSMHGPACAGPAVAPAACAFPPSWRRLVHAPWPLAQDFCLQGRSPSQSHECPCVPNQGAAPRCFCNICPQTMEAEGQCTNVSQSFSVKSSWKPLDWINQQTIPGTLVWRQSQNNLLAFGRWTCTFAMLWQLAEFDSVLTQHISQKLSLWGNLCVF